MPQCKFIHIWRHLSLSIFLELTTKLFISNYRTFLWLWDSHFTEMLLFYLNLMVLLMLYSGFSWPFYLQDMVCGSPHILIQPWENGSGPGVTRRNKQGQAKEGETCMVRGTFNLLEWGCQNQQFFIEHLNRQQDREERVTNQKLIFI